MRSPTWKRFILSSTVLVAITATQLASVTVASADPFVPDPKTSVITTQLALTKGVGYLTLQISSGFDALSGFSVDIPAAGGSWATPTKITSLELGTTCVGTPGTSLHYVCGSQPGHSSVSGQFPLGSFQITVPVRRTGPTSGLTGTITMYRLDGYGDLNVVDVSDTFPVVDATHFRSTAEVRNLYSTGSPTGLAVLAETVTVIPGETVNEIDTTLPRNPATSWHLQKALATNPSAFAGNLNCVLSPTTATTETIRCRAGSFAFPSGRYELDYKLAIFHLTDDEPAGTGTVDLAVNGKGAEVEDSFTWSSVFQS